MWRQRLSFSLGLLLTLTWSVKGDDFGSSRFSDTNSQSGRFDRGGRVSGNVGSSAGSRRGSGDFSVTGSDNSDRFAPTDENFRRLTTQDPRFDRSGSSDRDVSDMIANRGTSSDRNSGSDRFGSGDSNRDRNTDRFDSGNGNSDRFGSGSNSDRNSDRFGSNTGSRGSSFPENYRVEVDLVRMENKGGILANGKSCDVLSTCDPKLYGDIDLTGTGAWPKDPAYQKWTVIFKATNNDSPNIAKTLQKDVCQNRGQSSSSIQGVMRVRAVDEDSITQEDDMGKFDCVFTLRPSDVKPSAAGVQWSDVLECTGSTQVGKIKLFARTRAYEISTSACNAMRNTVIDTPKIGL
ncbi:uncharacterized protein LOC129594070 [Paramacrobiotus metropolitanus]|uniref:uncharacterized protein LOC129594070 n=1 Tax=Paramacrobiotus metropolitanus TaxID=2943436 RepID=UPI0024457E49|nr:uncharacterized protein LOC129594070 [Paramacrobiotus metropolitanus]